MKKLLLKKKQRITPRANGQTLLVIPPDLKEHFANDKKFDVEYYEEGNKFIILIEKEA